MARGFWQVVDAFFAFVDAPRPLPPGESSTLSRLLDELALASPEWGGAPPESDDDPPAVDASALRARLCARFPDFGLYRVGAPSAPGEGDDDAAVTLGDAIDDLLDICSDLHDARWYRDHGEAGDGERCAGELFHYHWGRHLRDLQSYLHRAAHES
ncbi:MAG: hypothetical protein ACON4Z_12715 [Planctomycetota bacterium]